MKAAELILRFKNVFVMGLVTDKQLNYAAASLQKFLFYYNSFNGIRAQIYTRVVKVLLFSFIWTAKSQLTTILV